MPAQNFDDCDWFTIAFVVAVQVIGISVANNHTQDHVAVPVADAIVISRSAKFIFEYTAIKSNK